MRFYLFFVLLFTLPFLNACSKKGDNNPAAVVGGISGGIISGLAAGQYAVVGIVNVNANCGSTVANVTVTNGYMGGQPIGSAQVGSGGPFNFPVPATGYGYSTYYLQATAGSCNVAGNVSALTNGQTPYTICLGAGGVCGGGYTNPYGGYTGGYYPYMHKAKNTPTDGSIQIPYSGNGDFAFGSTEIYVHPKKAGSFKLTLQYTSGNTPLSTNPAVSDGAWSGTVAADGTLTIAGQTVDHLAYASQVDGSLMTYDSAFCGSASDAIDKMTAYAKASGFSDKAVDGFKAAWDADAKSESVCVYPQQAKVADAVVALKSESKMDVNRLWFAVVPSGEVAGKKFTPSEKIAKLIGKAKVQTLAKLKKIPLNRKIASDNEFLAEELGYGFLIQK